MYKITGADDKEYGPIPAEVLRQWIAEGRANAQTRVLAEGAAEWKRLGEFPEFAPALAGPATPPLAPLPISALPTSRTNPLAVAGLILGIASVTFGLCCYGMPFNLAGLICSIIALSQLKTDAKQLGKGMAVVGLVLSIFSFFLGVGLAGLGYAFSNSDLLHKIQRL